MKCSWILISMMVFYTKTRASKSLTFLICYCKYNFRSLYNTAFYTAFQS